MNASEQVNELKLFLEKNRLDLESLSAMLTVEIPEMLREQISIDKGFYAVNPGTIQFVEPKIKLSEFLRYIKSSGDFVGFRMYPGIQKLSENNYALFLMLAGSTSVSNPNEVSNYYLFKNDNYSSLDPMDAVNSVVAQNFLHDYHQIVRIGMQPQGNELVFKRSRFYEIAEFDNYLRKLPPNANHNDYYVKIEIGYISKIISEDHLAVYYRSEFPESTSPRDYHQGFTCMFRVFDYATNTPLTTTLEIGSPCPPDCGSLTW